MQDQNPKPFPNLAPLWTLMIVGGCLLPFIVICLGALFTN